MWFSNCSKKLFDPPPEEPDYVPLPELANIRPGGFDWRRRDDGNDDDDDR